MSYIILHEKFEGPFDLLLDLIQQKRLAIKEISLAKITDDYLAYIRTLEERDPEALAEFLVIAAQLILIKSRSLLPSLAVSEEEEQSLGELEARLDEYKKIRDVVKDLHALLANGRAIAKREAFAQFSPVFFPPPTFAHSRLADAFRAVVATMPKTTELAQEKIRRIVSLQDKIAALRHVLIDGMEKFFSQLVGHASEKAEIIVSFLAILELTRQKIIEVRQEGMFGDIRITPFHDAKINH